MTEEAELYYTPPSDECFNEVKQNAIELWKEIDTDNDMFGYASEKIGRIKDLENVQDNFMYMVAMFDYNNQGILASRLSIETNKEIHDRIEAGGGVDYTFNSQLDS